MSPRHGPLCAPFSARQCLRRLEGSLGSAGPLALLVFSPTGEHLSRLADPRAVRHQEATLLFEGSQGGSDTFLLVPSQVLLQASRDARDLDLRRELLPGRDQPSVCVVGSCSTIVVQRLSHVRVHLEVQRRAPLRPHVLHRPLQRLLANLCREVVCPPVIGRHLVTIARSLAG